MRDRLPDLEKAGAQLIVVDPHESWPAKHFLAEVGFDADDVEYPLLLDPAQVVSATYGVAFQMRIHTEISNRPTTFIIDLDGVIRFEQRAKTFNDRPSPEDILSELARLR